MRRPELQPGEESGCDLRARLPKAFFGCDTLLVAERLIGCYLFSNGPTGLVGGRIVETEAYLGPDDLGAHSSGGRRTERNKAMYGPKGHAYVYLIYGMYWCANVVCGPKGLPQAVLIRALESTHGLDVMRSRFRNPNGAKDSDLCRGPGKLCVALGITKAQYGADLRGDQLFLVPGTIGSDETVRTSPRINIDYAGEWATKPWRFYVAGHRSVSGPAKLRR
jgi:DNA-3-methyladenine glycosylase